MLRHGKEKVFNVRITEPENHAKTEVMEGDQEVDSDKSKRLAGAFVVEIGPGHPLYGEINGLEVKKVRRNSPAEKAGLRRHDIIVSVNRKPLKSIKQLRKALNSKHSVLLNIRRGDGALFLVVE